MNDVNLNAVKKSNMVWYDLIEILSMVCNNTRGGLYYCCFKNSTHGVYCIQVTARINKMKDWPMWFMSASSFVVFTVYLS